MRRASFSDAELAAAIHDYLWRNAGSSVTDIARALRVRDRRIREIVRNDDAVGRTYRTVRGGTTHQYFMHAPVARSSSDGRLEGAEWA